MLPFWYMLRRSTLWGAVCIWLLPAPVLAQYVIPAPALPEAEKDPSGPDATYCRPAQPQTDSRLPGPKVCLTNRQWDALHKQGLDISADGKSTVASEKFRTLHNGPCHTQQDGCF
jgi:hypothetical protein